MYLDTMTDSTVATIAITNTVTLKLRMRFLRSKGRSTRPRL